MFKWLLCCSYLVCTTLFAQSLDDFRYASPLFKKVDDQGQIVGGVISAGLEARNGMFWFGSQNGLVSFDGYQFKRYPHDPNNINSPAADYIVALAEDEQGDIWLATRTSGLSRFSPRTHTFEHFNTGSSSIKLRSDTLRTLKFDQQGHLWLGHELGVDEIDIQNQRISYYDLPINNGICFLIYPDSSGKILIGSTKGMFEKEVQDQSFKTIEPLKGLDVRSIYRSSAGNYWLGTHSGLKFWDGEQAVVNHQSGPNSQMDNAYIRAIVPFSNGKVWVASYGKGLALYQEASGQFIKHFRHDASDPTSLAFDDVGTIFLSRNGTLLIGTWGEGLQLLNAHTSDHFAMLRHSLQHDLGLSFANVRTLLELLDGRLLAGTTGTGLDLIDPALGRVATIMKSATGQEFKNIVSLAQQADGTIWVGTASSGLLQLDLATLLFIEQPVKNLTTGSVLRLLVMDNQHLVVGMGKGVCIKRPQDLACEPMYKKDGSIMLDTPTALLEDAFHNLWISTHQGLYRLRPNSQVLDQFISNDSTQGLSHNYVLGMVEDQRGHLWITTSTGFDRVSNLEGDSVLIEQQKSLLGLYDKMPGGNMLFDSMGRIWSAVSLFNLQTQFMLPFNASLGIDIGTSWLGSYVKLRSGILAFGGIKGVVLVDPKGFEPNVISKKLIITKLKINDKNQVLAKLGALDLKPQENDFSIQVAVPDALRANEINYQYKLSSNEVSWRQLDTSSRVISLNNLDPGNYQLVIEARYEHFPQEIMPLYLSFNVQPYFWQTWWFKLLIALCSVALVFMIFRWRIGLVRAQALHLEEVVVQRTREISVINQIGQQFTLQLLLDDLLNVIYQQISQIFVADRFGIGILNEDGTAIEFNYAVERGIRYHAYSRLMNEPGQLAVYSVSHNQAILVSDYAQQFKKYYEMEDSATHSLASGQQEIKAVSMMYVPLQQNGTVIGVISIQSITKNSYDTHDLMLLETLASYASIAVSNAQSHQELLITHQALELNMQALKETQQQLFMNEKMTYLGQLVAGVAHEINTPIGIAITATSVVQDMTSELEHHVNKNTLTKNALSQFLLSTKQSLALIFDNTERAALLVQRFKQVAVNADDGVIQSVDLYDFCMSVVDSLSSTIKAHGVQTDIMILPNDKILTYPVVLGQVLFILIQNACIHGLSKSQKGQIKIMGYATAEYYRLDIIDNGCGIEEQVIGKIFEPFYTTTRNQGGTGLGLSIAYNLVHKILHGDLSCQSLAGQGATFSIELPLTDKLTPQL